GNWDANRVPGAADDAVISLTGITVTHSANVIDSIKSLTSQAAVNLSGGTLNVSGTLHADVPFTLSGGTLGNAIVDAATPIRGAGSSGRLSGIALNGNLDLATNSNTVTIVSGLTLGGTINLGKADGSITGQAIFEGTQTLAGTGTIVFGGSFANSVLTKGDV